MGTHESRGSCLQLHVLAGRECRVLEQNKLVDGLDDRDDMLFLDVP